MTRDDVLLKKIKGGDMSAMDELVRVYYPDMLRYCLWHTRNRQTAEDATQETFLKVISSMEGYVHRSKFKAFLYKIASNVCTDQWRRQEAEPLPDALQYIERGFEQTESEISLLRIIEPLTKQQQEVILLRFVHELKVREIAEVLGEPMRTTQTRLRTALKRIEKNLKGEANA